MTDKCTKDLAFEMLREDLKEFRVEYRQDMSEVKKDVSELKNFKLKIVTGASVLTILTTIAWQMVAKII